MHRLFDPVINRSAGLGAGLDWKTSLQELTASGFLGVPEYQVEESGPDHQKFFRATVKVGGRSYGTGSGRSKKEAEQQAAEAAWKAISNGHESAAAHGATPAAGVTPAAGRRGRDRPRPGTPPPRPGTSRPGADRCRNSPRSRPSGPAWRTTWSGRTIEKAQVLHPRAIRRHLAGQADFEDVLRGRTITGARRRGKYLWLPMRRRRAAGPPGHERAAAGGRAGPAAVQPRPGPLHVHRCRP